MCSSASGKLLELSLLTYCVAPASGKLLELSLLTNCVAPASGKLQELSLVTYCIAPTRSGELLLLCIQCKIVYTLYLPIV